MTKKLGIHPGVALFLAAVVAFIGLRIWDHYSQRVLMVSKDGEWVIDIHGQQGELNRRIGTQVVTVPVKFHSSYQGVQSIRVEVTKDGAGLAAGTAIGCYVLGKRESRLMFCEGSEGFAVPKDWQLWLGGFAKKAGDSLKLKQTIATDS